MNNFLNKLSYYFKDSYGMDKLSKHLFIAGLIFMIFRHTSTFGVVCILYSGWRCISKNKYKRYRELQSYEKFISPIIFKFNNFKAGRSKKLYYKILKCPNCSQKLRVPKHKGKMTVTCSKCATSFRAKS